MTDKINSSNTGESTPLLGNTNGTAADSIHRHRLRTTTPHDVNTFRQQSRYKCIYIFLELSIIGAILLMLKIALERTASFKDHITHHSHTFPTLLLTRDHVDGVYLNALSNPLYDEMKHAHYISNIAPSLELTRSGSSEDNTVQHKWNHHTFAMAPIPMLQLSTDELSYHDDLRISWNPNDGHIQDWDIMAMYCPSSEKDPSKFKDAATISQVRRTSQEVYKRMMMTTKNTDSSLDMINMDANAWWIPSFPLVRENTCMFRIWKRIEDHDYTNETTTTISNASPNTSFVLAAHSDTLHITNGIEQPTMIHLALTSIPSEMRVHFTTGIEGRPLVVYGTDRTMLLQRAYGQSTTYTKNDLCQEPASIEEPGKFSSPGMLHSVIMSNLSEDTVYFYKVAVMGPSPSSSDRPMTWSEIYSFRSPIFPGSQTPFSFVVYADQGVPGYGNRNMADYVTSWTEREVQQNEIRSIHHFGDLSYAQGVGHLWDQWLDMVSAFSTAVPLMIGVGNHEYDHTAGGENGKDPSGVVTASGFMPSWGDMGDDSHGECGVPTSKRFIMPSNGNGVFWYSFDYGMVHTIVLSSEHDLSPSSTQYRWLESDLRRVNRTETPWLIVEAHRPMYCSLNSPKDNLVGDAMRREFEHLLYQYNVDLFLAGHYHIYQRSCYGLYQSKCRAGGPTHIIIGSAGADLDLTAPLLRRPWTASFIRENGYGRISVLNSTALHFEFISNADDTVKDETWLTK